MALLDKLAGLRSQPADADLLDYLGISAADQFSWTADSLTVGSETIPMVAAKLAMNGGPIPRTDRPRAIKIGDL